MNSLRFLALTLLPAMVLPAARSAAQQPASAERVGSVTYDELSKVGDMVFTARDYRDNQLLYDVKVRELFAYSHSLEGARISFQTPVIQVTREEVIVDVPDAGRTRVAVVQNPAQQVPGGVASRFYVYYGPPSTARYNLLAAPTVFRIGRDIDLELAERLRRGDILTVTGKVQSFFIDPASRFYDDTAVTIGDVRVVRLEP